MEGYRDRVSAFLFNYTKFLFNYTKRMNAHFSAHGEEVDGYRQRFLDTMAFVSRNFPWGFRRTPKGNATPRTRFEAIAIGSYLALRDRPELVYKMVEVDSWLGSPDFARITGSDGANVTSRLKARLYFVRDNLLGEQA